MLRFPHFGFLALLLVAGIDTPSLIGQGPAPAAAKKASLKQPSLAELAKLYQDLDLPLPPKNAFFAIVDQGTSYRYAPYSKPEIDYQLHFATGGPYPKAPYWIWESCKISSAESLAVIFRKPPSPDDILPFLRLRGLRGSVDTDNENSGELVFAIQCHLLEHFELARFFFRRCQKSEKGPFDQTLVLIAWNYWATELGNSKRDLTVVSKKLHHIVAKHRFFEVINQWPSGDIEEVERDVQDHRTLLDRLELTLKPTHAKPGSIEALIEELLIDSEAAEGWDFLPPEAEKAQDKDPSSEGTQRLISPEKKLDAKAKLRNLGFAAIPMLIDHVDDQRLVRHPPLFLGPLIGLGQQGGNRMMTVNTRSFRTVSSSVREILPAFLNVNKHKATKEDYLKSWNAIKSMKESDFVTKNLESTDDQTWQFLHFAREKYAGKLIEAYKVFLRKKIDIKYMGFLIHTIANADLPKGTKVDLLLQGASTGDLSRKYQVLDALESIDRAAFSKLLVEILDKAPKDGLSEKDERWSLNLIELGFRSMDPVARATVEKLTRGLPLNLRLKVLESLSDGIFVETTGQKTRSFLLSFLEDSTIYQPGPKDRQGGITLDHDLTGIEVRNFVAKSILKSMNIDIPVGDKTTEETWTQIRDLAKEEIERRLEKKKLQ